MKTPKALLREHLKPAHLELLDALDDDALERHWEVAHQAWPCLTLTRQDFFEHISSACEPWLERGDLSGWFERLQAADFYLARCCLEGDAAAIDGFCAQLDTQLMQLVRRFSTSAAHAQDLRQQLLEKLFVWGPQRRPRISEYSGQGFLLNWLRVTATRAFIDLQRNTSGVERHQQTFEQARQLQTLELSSLNMELELLKQSYRLVFKRAFSLAIEQLPARARLILRHSFIEGLSIDQIGAIYGVHRATAARWLVDARGQLATQTRQLMSQELELSPQELESIITMIYSRLEVSMGKLVSQTT